MDATLDEILAELDEHDPECAKCGALTTSKIHWQKASKAERAEMRADGYVIPGARGMCLPCYIEAKRAGEHLAFAELPRGFAQGTRTKFRRMTLM